MRLWAIAQKAEKYYRIATESDYGWNEMKYRRALAYQKLGEQEKADELFSGLIEHGQELLSGDRRSDFFEKFSADENERSRNARAHYLIGLGKLGFGNQREAQQEFKQTLELNPAHLAKVFIIILINNK